MYTDSKPISTHVLIDHYKYRECMHCCGALYPYGNIILVRTLLPQGYNNFAKCYIAVAIDNMLSQGINSL